jgi:hypothetical protein
VTIAATATVTTAVAVTARTAMADEEAVATTPTTTTPRPAPDSCRRCRSARRRVLAACLRRRRQCQTRTTRTAQRRRAAARLKWRSTTAAQRSSCEALLVSHARRLCSCLVPHPSSSLILHPSALTLHSSFFILHPSCFIPHSSSFIFRGVMLCADAVSLYRRRAMSPLPAFMGSGASDTASVGRDSAAGGTTVKLVHGRQSPALRGRTHVNAPSPDTIVASVSLSLLPARCETFRFGCALRG